MSGLTKVVIPDLSWNFISKCTSDKIYSDFDWPEIYALNSMIILCVFFLKVMNSLVSYLQVRALQVWLEVLPMLPQKFYLVTIQKKLIFGVLGCFFMLC